ncbi:MAG: VWA domain-containing protein [Actinomycetota bacterium]|nr:VWA domain-containing protein [Actinomycetota bacterium]
MAALALVAQPTVTATAAPAAPLVPTNVCGPLDVALLIDDTGSMGGAINNIKAGINTIVNDVVALSGGDYKLGLITFKDNVSVHSDLAAGTGPAVTNYVTNTLAVGGGVNEPEASDEAVNTAVNNLLAGPPRPQTGNFAGAWRSEATKVVVLITDARPGGFDDVHTAADVTNAHTRATEALSDGIKISAVHVGNSAAVTPILQDYATTTGGVYTHTPDGSAAAAGIQQILADCERTDVFTRDVAGDTGAAPHALSPIWMSPDIKVCNTSTECAVSENPIAGGDSWIFVKLNNPGPGGTGTGAGTLKVYRTSLGTAASWDPVTLGNWTFIGEDAGLVVPPGVTTARIKWTNVPGPAHFCLLTRWVSASDPMTTPEGANTFTNTRNNNNIAWRNVNSVAVAPGTSPETPEVRPLTIRNPLPTQIKTDLAFVSPREQFLAAGGRLVVDLGPELAKRWRDAGQLGVGVRLISETQVQIADPRTARIQGLTLNPKDEFTLKLLFSAATTAKLGAFPLQINQLNGRDDLGGAQFDITIGRPIK